MNLTQRYPLRAGGLWLCKYFSTLASEVIDYTSQMVVDHTLPSHTTSHYTYRVCVCVRKMTQKDVGIYR